MVAERKKKIVNEFQKLMKESAFDCTLNYNKNILNTEDKNLLCLDYNTKNRDEYIYTPNIDDTIDTIDITQEKFVVDKYKDITIKDKLYYYIVKEANYTGKLYIYEYPKIRTPKPIGEIKIINGERKFGLYKKKDKHNKKNTKDKKNKKDKKIKR